MNDAESEFVNIGIALPRTKELHFRNRDSADYGHGMPSLRVMEFIGEGHSPSQQFQEYLTSINPLRTRNHEADWLRKRYKLLRRAALRGNAEALNDLGWIFSNELCYPADQYLAEQLFQLAAATGCPGEAWFNLAEQELHELLFGTDRLKKMNCFYRMADAHGIAAAATRLGGLYWGSEEGHEVDLEQARRWLLRGAESGEAGAAYQLGVLLLDPNKPVYDQGNALYWLQAAALCDDPEAISRLQDFYESADGTRLDPGGRLLAFWKEQGERVYRLPFDPDNDLPVWPYKLIKRDLKECA